MKHIFLILIILASYGKAFCVPDNTLPVIHFLNMIYAPKTGGENNKGAHIYVRGENFGASRGANTITIGGGTADNYTVWNDTYIWFQLGANAATGNIVVNVGGNASNGISFTVNDAMSIYFVDSSVGGPGDGSFADPWSDASDYYTQITNSTGNICYFRDGTYNQEYGDPGHNANFKYEAAQTGTLDAPNCFIGYPEEFAVFYGTAGATARHCFKANAADAKYIVIANLIMRSNRASYLSSNLGGFGSRIIANDCIGDTEFSATGVIHITSSSYRVFGNSVHGGASGSNSDHAIYGQQGIDNKIAYNHIWGNDFGRGPQLIIHLDNAIDNGNIMEYEVFNNLIDVSSVPSRAIAFFETGGVSTGVFYNNVIIGNPPFTYPTVYAISGNTYWYSNTISSGGSSSGESWVFFGSTENGDYYSPNIVQMTNNITYSASDAEFYLNVTPGVDTATATLNTNLWFGLGDFASNSNGQTGTDTGGIDADPLFTDRDNFDVTILSTSPAKNVGTDLSSVFTRDFLGTLRDDTWDIGAYEYGEAAASNIDVFFFMLD